MEQEMKSTGLPLGKEKNTICSIC